MANIIKFKRGTTANVAKLNGVDLPLLQEGEIAIDITTNTIKVGDGLTAWNNLRGINAETATKLATARTIELTGDVTGSTTFDGSGNVSIPTTISKGFTTQTVAFQQSLPTSYATPGTSYVLHYPYLTDSEIAYYCPYRFPNTAHLLLIGRITITKTGGATNSYLYYGRTSQTYLYDFVGYETNSWTVILSIRGQYINVFVFDSPHATSIYNQLQSISPPGPYYLFWKNGKNTTTNLDFHVIYFGS